MAGISVRSRYAIFLTAVLVIISLLYFKHDGERWNLDRIGRLHKDTTGLQAPDEDLPAEVEAPPPPPPEPTLIYKNITVQPPPILITEHFPLAAKAKSSADLPPIPSWNKPPATHVPEKTPLFIGFTRNWPLLQQVVVGYITAGWPPEDIYVVENTGVMDSNKKGRLTLQNPFYLDHHRLTKIFGVKIIVTPTLLTFAQLQNLYLSEAINNDYPYYFWSHMDVLPQSAENVAPYKSLYLRAVDAIRESVKPGYANDAYSRTWALRYFSYDWLTLVNTASSVELGGWDSMISYYGTDCDMYERFRMARLATNISNAGKIWDMGASLEDLEILYRRRPKEEESAENQARAYTGEVVEDTLNSTYWHALQEKLHAMEEYKVHGEEIRNAWQTKQSGGQGEPFYRDQAGFEEALEITIHAGEAVYRAKWGQKRCDLRAAGLKLDDQWRVEPGWED